MGNSLSVDGGAPIHMFTSSKAWIEGDATRQLQQVSCFDGVTAVAAMPDLHPGKFGPVGCAVLSQHVYPSLVGADIGCGMGLFALDLAVRRVRPDKAAERLRALGGSWEGDAAARLEEMGLGSSAFDGSLGTIGGGNHFCELQAIDEIFDAQAAAAAGLDCDRTYVLVHSGSRGLGFSILERFLAGSKSSFQPECEEGRAYLAAHDDAVRWAKLNRQVIAERAAEALSADVGCLADLSHNFAEQTAIGVLHRKGVASSDRGLVPVPGSRGALSYVMKPASNAPVESLASMAHGAGRKYERGAMHGRVGRKRSDVERLQRNPFGGLVVCEDRNLLVEEAPEAYKSIGQVVDDLVTFGLASVVATFRPLLTFKSIRDDERKKRANGNDRREARARKRGEDWR